MSEKSEKIIKEQLAGLADISQRLPAYEHVCTELARVLMSITDHKWIERNLGQSKLSIAKVYNSDRESVEFKSVNLYPLFRKEMAGDKRLQSIPRPLTHKSCLDLRDAFLEVGRHVLTEKAPITQNESIEEIKPVFRRTDPERLDFTKDQHGTDPDYCTAIKRAIELFHEQYSMANCVLFACKKTGYKVKARVSRGLRAHLSAGELEERRLSAKARHGFSGEPMKQSTIALFKEMRVNENHLKDILAADQAITP